MIGAVEKQATMKATFVFPAPISEQVGRVADK